MKSEIEREAVEAALAQAPAVRPLLTRLTRAAAMPGSHETNLVCDDLELSVCGSELVN